MLFVAGGRPRTECPAHRLHARRVGRRVPEWACTPHRHSEVPRGGSSRRPVGPGYGLVRSRGAPLPSGVDSNEDEQIPEMLSARPRVVEQLLPLALDYPDPLARWQIDMILPAALGDRAIEPLRRLVRDRDDYVRRRAHAALSAWSAPDWHTAVFYPDPHVWASAVDLSLSLPFKPPPQPRVARTSPLRHQRRLR